jgi:FMN phosphatase YigB (HAD superfamily)
MRTVLVLSGGGYQGLALVRALRRLPDLRIVLADTHEQNVTRHLATAFRLAPPLARHEAFARFLLDTCREEAVDVLLPSTDHELPALEGLRSAVESLGVAVLACGPELRRLGDDKIALASWLQQQGLPTLPTVGHPDELALPLIGKPRRGFGSKGLRVLRTEAERAALDADALAGMAWQPWLERFDEYSVDLAVRADGEVSPPAVRRRVRTLGGLSILGEPVGQGPAWSLAAELAARLPALGARGLLNVQILESDGQCWVSDLNARVGTSMPLSLAAGFDPLAFLLGLPPPPPQPLPRATFRAFEEHAVQAVDTTAVKGVVFDLDDTLLDLRDWVLRKLELTWEAAQSMLGPRSDFMRQMLWLVEEGHLADLMDAYAAQAGLGDVERQRLIEDYRSARPEGCRLAPDAPAMLDELRRRGYRLGLLTDNPARGQRQKIEVAQLAGSFDAIVLTAELGQRKPAALAFEAVAGALSLEPAALAMVGDNLYRDSLGALEAGFAHAFHVRLPGALFDFCPRRAARCLPADRLSRVTPLATLTELGWYLPAAPR